MTEAEEFLKKRAGRCERLRMWLTPEGCAAIRSRGPERWAYQDGVVGPPTQCVNCPGVIIQPDAYQAPAKPYGSSIMTEQTYTIMELAALLGVSPKDVANAKYAKSKNPMPGTKMALVRDGMAARGITWEQVVTSPRGKKAEAETASAAPAPVEKSASLPPVTEPDIAQAAELADVVADMEPEDAPPLPSTAEKLPLGQAIARELDTWELQKGVSDRLAGSGPVPGSIGAVMSLEDILGELRRRLPGAAITISLQ